MKPTIHPSVFPDEMTPIEIHSTEKLMYPASAGGTSEAGFLSEDERLIEVYEKDQKTLARLGITFDQVADRLQDIAEKAFHNAHLMSRFHVKNKYGDTYWDLVRRGVPVDGKMSVSFESYMGYQDCPFQPVVTAIGPKGSKCDMSDTDFTVCVGLKNRGGRPSFFFSWLHIHLIRDHHFFEGNTKYRLDPETCVKALDLQPGVSYKPTYTSQTRWKMVSGSCGGEPSLKELLDVARECVKLHSSPWTNPCSPDLMDGKNIILLPPALLAWCDGNHLLVVSAEGKESETMVNGHELEKFGRGVELYRTNEFTFVEDPTIPYGNT